MKKLLILFLLLGGTAMAQPYKLGIGARLGYPASLSLKYFTNEELSLEGILGYRGYGNYSWTMIGATLNKNQTLNFEDIEGLTWYYGGGLAFFSWNWSDRWSGPAYSTSTFGIIGQLGLEYKFEKYPLAISADWMPLIHFSGYSRGWGSRYGGLAVRYTLKSGK